MSTILVYETARLQTAVYIDLNSMIGINLDPDLVTDVKAIRSSIYTILMTPLGTRYRLPEFGSALLWLLAEPHDDTTAFQIRNAVLQAVGRWETRIQLDALQTTVNPFGVDGYSINVVFSMPRFAQTSNFSMDIRRP